MFANGCHHGAWVSMQKGKELSGHNNEFSELVSRQTMNIKSDNEYKVELGLVSAWRVKRNTYL